MKSKLTLLFLCSTLLLLSGCSFDESLEKTQQNDGDDMNVIQDVGPQALDQVLRSSSSSPSTTVQSSQAVTSLPSSVSTPTSAPETD